MSEDEDLRREVDRLRSEVEALHRRLDSLETDDDARREADHVTAATDTSPDTAVAESVESAADRDGAEAGSDWELAVGVRWLGLVGALALVVGVVLFVRLAIDMGLLGPLGRIAVGTIGGVLLFGIGRYVAIRQRYVRWGRIAAGAGLAVAYFSLYAAYAFESYRAALGTPLWVVLVGMTALVVVTAIVSVRDRAPLVVGEAFLLGYVTASLSTDAATLLLTPAYVLLLAAGMVAIARVTAWRRFVVTSPFATYGILGLWVLDVDPAPAILGTAASLALLVHLIGAAVVRGTDPEGRWRSRTLELVLTVSNAVFAAVLLETAVRDAVSASSVEGMATAAVALLLVGAFVVSDRRPYRPDEPAAGTAIVLLAAAVAMAVGPFGTTVGALAIIVVGVTAARAGEAPAFRYGTHVVAAGLAVKLLAVDATELPAFDVGAPAATLTGRPVSFALAIGVFYGLAWWYAAGPSTLTEVERVRPAGADGIYAGVATGLAVILLGLELSGLAVSIAWGVFGFVLLGIGLSIDVRGLRVLGIGVLGIATGKVFLYDTRDLDTVARTLSFLALGVILLTASYIYARLRDDVDVGVDLLRREGG